MKLILAILALTLGSTLAQATESNAYIKLGQKIFARDSLAATAACARDGASCIFGSDCCGGNCNANNVCGSPAFCEGNGRNCSLDSECCSAICNDSTGKCGLSERGSCKALGESCSLGSECCNGACNANHACADDASCNGNGESCSLDSGCCSNHCNRNNKCE